MHTGGMHKKAPGLVANALHSVATDGFTVADVRPCSDSDPDRDRKAIMTKTCQSGPREGTVTNQCCRL